MNKWQPIETAPKDGSWILLGNPIWEVCWQGHWFAGDLSYPEYHGARLAGWKRFNSDAQLPVDATHWQPLPKPPKD